MLDLGWVWPHFIQYNHNKIERKISLPLEAGVTKDIMSIEEIVRLADR
jgi:hypothetical protein